MSKRKHWVGSLIDASTLKSSEFPFAVVSTNTGPTTPSVSELHGLCGDYEGYIIGGNNVKRHQLEREKFEEALKLLKHDTKIRYANELTFDKISSKSWRSSIKVLQRRRRNMLKYLRKTKLQ